jgi:DNA polymerase I-like protein with 3'-5' exonuclease and polymerase domains
MPGSPDLWPDGLIHPILSTTKTRTWRTSSESPNEQNWPKREHREIRSQIAAPAGYKIVSFDYASIQARNVAMESKDHTLVKSFWDRYDIHGDWANRIASICPSWVPGGRRMFKEDKDLFKKYRNIAKNGLVFPSFFGAYPKKIATVCKIPVEAAESLHDDFWTMFPEIKNWHEEIQVSYRENGYVTGLSGFRRRAPISSNEMINAPIQADEAIIVLTAMATLSELGNEALQPNMEIHDDLTFIWRDRDIDENAEKVIDVMLDVPFDWAHNVPIGVEMSVGQNWSDGKAVGEYYSDQWKGMLRP